jgi:hypothetical protein
MNEWAIENTVSKHVTAAFAADRAASILIYCAENGQFGMSYILFA